MQNCAACGRESQPGAMLCRACEQRLRARSFTAPPGARRDGRAPAAMVLIALNIAIFAVGLFLQWRYHLSEDPMVGWFGDAGVLVRAGQYWRPFTAMFIHLGYLHIFFNMVCLYSWGRVAEQTFNTSRFIAIYIVAGLGASLLGEIVHPRVLAVGASGAIFGVAGALFAPVLMGKTEMIWPRLIEPKKQLMKFIGLNLLIGLLPGIDNAGHIGGLITGFAVGGYLASRMPSSPTTPDQVSFGPGQS